MYTEIEKNTGRMTLVEAISPTLSRLPTSALHSPRESWQPGKATGQSQLTPSPSPGRLQGTDGLGSGSWSWGPTAAGAHWGSGFVLTLQGCFRWENHRPAHLRVETPIFPD